VEQAEVEEVASVHATPDTNSLTRCFTAELFLSSLTFPPVRVRTSQQSLMSFYPILLLR